MTVKMVVVHGLSEVDPSCAAAAAVAVVVRS